jgi:hypothetical protein
MERFIVPTLIRIIAKNKVIARRHALDYPSENDQIIVLNVVGHSRGIASQRCSGCLLFLFVLILFVCVFFIALFECVIWLTCRRRIRLCVGRSDGQVGYVFAD